jgi:Taurine catabolism dioxygenase TauD, TfdA family
MTSTTNTELDICSPALEDQQEQSGSLFPLAYVCQSSGISIDDAVRWVASKKEELLQQATSHGAVVFRDFPVQTAEDFDAFVSALAIPNFPYRKSLSNAVRTNRTKRVFTANEAPSNVDIFFHHEMAQTPIYPRWIMFFCERAADEGGATQLCRSDWLYERLTDACPEFIRACEQKGLQYTNVMPAEDDAKSGMGRSWRSTLEVETKEAAEQRLAELGYSHEWTESGCLRATTPPLPAVMKVAPGRKTFFNQLIAAYGGWKDSRNDPSEAIRHGDGSKLDASAVAKAIAISEELSFEAHWQAGDVAVLDNTIVMHGRRPFVGVRKVLASLSTMQDNQFQIK